MNIGRIKLLLWAAVVVLVSYLGWDVYQFLTVVKAELRAPLPEEKQIQYLVVPEPEEEQRELVPYERVQRTFFDMKWDGRPEAKIETPIVKPTEQKTPQVPVSDLLTILLIQFHTGNPEESLATVIYHYGPKDRAVLKMDDRLRGKHSYAYVSEVTAEYIEISFDTKEGEEEREPERVSPPEFKVDGRDVAITEVGADGVLQEPGETPFIDVAADVVQWNPARTTLVRKGQYRIGYEDAANVAANWSTLLSRELKTKRYRDPQTGRYAGIQVTAIQPGSLIEAHGLEPGDVVKSINGDPVTSTQEAISYVKTNSDTTTHWIAVIERQGREMSLTYDYEPTQN